MTDALKCPNCSAAQPATHSGPLCFCCGAKWIRCSCPAPIEVRGQTFMPSRSNNCPVHHMRPLAEPDPVQQPTQASAEELIDIHQKKLDAAGLFPEPRRH